jgi:hypothetical protein
LAVLAVRVADVFAAGGVAEKAADDAIIAAAVVRASGGRDP